MPNNSHYSPIRRLLFPYSGEEALTRAQGIRVIITWALFFSLALLIGTLPVIMFLQVASVQYFILMLLGILLIGVVLFGLSAWFVVFINNQSARIRQRQKAESAVQNSSNSGGRYGS